MVNEDIIGALTRVQLLYNSFQHRWGEPRFPNCSTIDRFFRAVFVNFSFTGSYRLHGDINFIALIFIVEELLLELIFFTNDKGNLRAQRNWDTLSVKKIFHWIACPVMAMIGITLGDCDIGFSHLVEGVFLVDELVERGKDGHFSPLLPDIFCDLEKMMD